MPPPGLDFFFLSTDEAINDSIHKINGLTNSGNTALLVSHTFSLSSWQVDLKFKASLLYKVNSGMLFHKEAILPPSFVLGVKPRPQAC